MKLTRTRILKRIQRENGTFKGLGNCARTRRKSNCLQMMQGKISETAEDREGRLEYQRNVTCSSRMSIWKKKKMLPTPTSIVQV
ncbi:hypothetical protein TNCV_4097481 [Trichonephila clavipes]|nr:hypothetical protein TNCV_4097481 [Trichonephila clavipes]